MAMMAMAGMMLASCMGDSYADPDMVETIPAPPYGNNLLKEKNVVTIAQLKSDYKTTITGGGYKLIDKPMMIKGYITGNDISGNLYQEVALQDETGAILVDINAGGLHGYLPVGQEILIDLNGLYIGGYGKQAEIGMPYTNAKGNSYVSRMSRVLWNKHFKLTGVADASKVVAEEFDVSKRTKEEYFTANNGKLMTIKNVEFTNADGKTTFAPSDEKDAANSVNRGLSQNGKPIATSSIVVRTSSYADFAAKQLPTGKLNITGVFTRYRTTWQILIRDERDIQPAE